jgi:hypothetical protein
MFCVTEIGGEQTWYKSCSQKSKGSKASAAEPASSILQQYPKGSEAYIKLETLKIYMICQTKFTSSVNSKAAQCRIINMQSSPEIFKQKQL